jgi:serine/threonine protein kinase
MIGPQRELIVMDFGLARIEGEERKTQTGQVFGTAPYMSPEQVQGHAGDMGKGCDIYTLGVIFYQLLTGRLPFPGPAWELPQQIVRLDPALPSSINPEVDPGLDAIVLRAMAKEIPDRFGSMTEFAEAIATYLQGVGSLSSSGVSPRTTPEPARAAPPEPVPPNPKRRPVGFPVQLRPEPLREPGRPRLKAWDGLVWGSIAALALVGVNVFLATDRSPPKSPPAGSRAEPAPVVERSRGPAKVMPVSTRDGKSVSTEAPESSASRRISTETKGQE